MEKHEVTKILAILSAFYGQGKSDTQAMSIAWSYILAPYDYHAAERAVIRFAKSDTRDYATFPAPGTLVHEIEREQGLVNRVFNKMYQGQSYDSLTAEEKRVISEADYTWGRNQDPEYLLAHRGNFLEKVRVLEAPHDK